MKPRHEKITALICCGALLLIFSVTAKQAWSKKGATFDEPLHITSALIQVHDFDFRCDPEDPPLWKYFVAAGTGKDALAINENDPSWNDMLASAGSWVNFAQATLYAQPAAMDAAIKAGRARMIFLGVALGALIGWWAWRLAGSIAAVVAIAVFCLDPNFLAHSPLIKNDVAISLIFLSFAAALWLLGERATIPRWGLVTLLLDAALTTKFSGLLAIPILAIVLAIRALLPQPWPISKWTVESRNKRLLGAATIAIASLLASYFLTWAVYGFRFSPTPNATEVFNNSVLDICKYRETLVAHGYPPHVAMSDLNDWSKDWHPSATVRSVQWLNAHRILPQAYLEGFLYTYATSLNRPTFLLGETNISGWWYYFPLAMIFKTPLATILATALAVISLRWWKSTSPNSWLLCAAILPIIYTLAAMRSHLNLGIRHMLPVYPFLFIFLGVAAARSIKKWPRTTATLIVIFLIGLTTETYAAFPDFIPFFNIAAGGSRGGLNLLSDSNIDWGQELPALAKWQTENPDRPLYLCYFGSSDPRFYGIHYVNLPGSDALPNEQPSPTTDRPAIAISAPMLQGVALDHVSPDYYEPFKRMEPFKILGGSIYLFDPPPQWMQPPGGSR